MAAKISSIKNRLDYLYELTDRCNKVKLPLAAISLLGISGTAVSASLFGTPYAGETLGLITASCAVVTALSVGGFVFVDKVIRDSDDEIFDIEVKYSEDLEKYNFMERISSYTR